MGRQGLVCGAITGGLMALGLTKGRSSRTESREMAYNVAKELQSRFRAAFGTVMCRELTGCDLSTPEGLERFKATNQHEKCFNYIRLAVETVIELAK